jgi:hypothetical protein
MARRARRELTTTECEMKNEEGESQVGGRFAWRRFI